jgi:hypothetical protein
VRLIYRLALEGDGTSGPMGVKAIVSYLNARHSSPKRTETDGQALPCAGHCGS